MTSAPRPLGSRYELRELLGSGAMGEVWRAVDRERGSEVAAKLLRAEFARDTEIVTRFIQERSILMDLRHPNIVRVHDLVVEGDRLGIVMDLVEGGDLRGRLRGVGTLGARDAVLVVSAILDGLAAAHAQGCLHRDVKPDNVLLSGPVLDPGAVRLSDFSIARLAQESTVMATGLLGTPSYMPPELFLHGRFSAASDVYAAGVVLYELLAGRTPFSGPGTAHTVGHRHVTAAPPRIPVPDALWHVLATMLAKDPAVRLSASGTARALRELPDEALERPALPVQADPEHWATAGTDEPSGRIKVHDVPTDLDPGRTNLHGATVTQTPVARAGEVRALVPAPEVEGSELTSVERPRPEHQAPVLAPGASAEPERTRKPWLAWLAGGLVVLGLVGGGVAFAQSRHGGDGGETGSAGATTPVTRASLGSDPLPTGLTVSREAEYDPVRDELRLTIRYTTQAAPLTGPFLEVVPAATASEQCPAVTWGEVAATENIGRTTGILTPCAYAVDVPSIPAQSSREVTATVDVDLGDDPEAVSSWLERAATSTDDALSGESVQPAAYPVQRLVDVQVDVPSGVSMGVRDLDVVLRPVWVSGPEDRVTVLFRNTTGESSGMLDQVAGGLDGVTLDESCGGALSVTAHHTVSVLRPAEDCRIDAEVGNFDVESSPFTIAGLGG